MRLRDMQLYKKKKRYISNQSVYVYLFNSVPLPLYQTAFFHGHVKLSPIAKQRLDRSDATQTRSEHSQFDMLIFLDL